MVEYRAPAGLGVRPRPTRLLLALPLLLVIAVGCAFAVGETERSTHVAASRPDRLAVIRVGDSNGLRARPVDPATLDDMPGGVAIDLGHHYAEALSPDGSLLAVVRYPTQDAGAEGDLQLVDVETWTVRSTDVTVDESITGLTFSPDGKALYWALPTAIHPAHGMGRDYALYGYGIGSGSLEQLVTFDSSFTPWEMRALPSGGIAVFGVPTDIRNLAEGPPRVVIVDPESAELTADVSLDGLTAGQRERTDAEVRFDSHRPGLAWDTVRQRLYVAHADEDTVTVVDLEAGRVIAEGDIHAARSPLEHIARWLVPVATAKLVPGTERAAVLSPDGERLYVATRRLEMFEEAGSRRFRELPLGGWVVNTDELRMEAAITQPVSELALSPDGETLLLSGESHEFGEGEPGTSDGSGLYVLDATTLAELAHLEPGTHFSLRGFAPSGRYAYAVGWGEGDGHVSAELLVLDLESRSFTATRRLGSYADVVLSE